MSRSSGGCSGKGNRDYKETIGRTAETVRSHSELTGSPQSGQSGSEVYYEADTASRSASISSEASATKVCIGNPDPEGVYGDDEQRPVWIRPPHQAFDCPKDKPLQETDIWPQGLWASQDTNSKVRVLAFVGSRAWREELRRSEILGPAEPHVGDPFADTRACNIAPSPNVSENDQDYDAQVRKFLNDQQLTVVWPASDWYKDGS